jgi:hypothetical protein
MIVEDVLLAEPTEGRNSRKILHEHWNILFPHGAMMLVCD